MDMYLLFSLSTISSISWLCTFCFYFIIIIFAMRYVDLGFPSSADSKESACNAGDLGLIPGLGRSPRGGHGNPLQYSCLENPDGQRSLTGYSPWGCKESDVTE